MPCTARFVCIYSKICCVYYAAFGSMLQVNCRYQTSVFLALAEQGRFARVFYCALVCSAGYDSFFCCLHVADLVLCLMYAAVWDAAYTMKHGIGPKVHAIYGAVNSMSF